MIFMFGDESRLCLENDHRWVPFRWGEWNRTCFRLMKGIPPRSDGLGRDRRRSNRCSFDARKVSDLRSVWRSSRCRFFWSMSPCSTDGGNGIRSRTAPQHTRPKPPCRACPARQACSRDGSPTVRSAPDSDDVGSAGEGFPRGIEIGGRTDCGFAEGLGRARSRHDELTPRLAHGLRVTEVPGDTISVVYWPQGAGRLRRSWWGG